MTVLSVLDQSPIRDGGTPAQAIRETVDLARATERMGFHRYWLAEHHSSAGLAGTAPEVLIARVAAETRQMRIGSGGVMLSHYSALKVAELYGVDELVIVSICYDFSARVRSYELLAEAFGLKPRQSG